MSLLAIKNFFDCIAKHIATDWFGVDYVHEDENSESDIVDDVDNVDTNYTVINMEPCEDTRVTQED